MRDRGVRLSVALQAVARRCYRRRARPTAENCRLVWLESILQSPREAVNGLTVRYEGLFRNASAGYSTRYYKIPDRILLYTQRKEYKIIEEREKEGRVVAELPWIFAFQENFFLILIVGYRFFPRTSFITSRFSSFRQKLTESSSYVLVFAIERFAGPSRRYKNRFPFQSLNWRVVQKVS